jgi:hypothetical protein
MHNCLICALPPLSSPKVILRTPCDEICIATVLHLYAVGCVWLALNEWWPYEELWGGMCIAVIASFAFISVALSPKEFKKNSIHDLCHVYSSLNSIEKWYNNLSWSYSIWVCGHGRKAGRRHNADVHQWLAETVGCVSYLALHQVADVLLAGVMVVNLTSELKFVYYYWMKTKTEGIWKDGNRGIDNVELLINCS